MPNRAVPRPSGGERSHFCLFQLTSILVANKDLERQSKDQWSPSDASETLAYLMVERCERLTESLEGFSKEHDKVLFDGTWMSREDALRSHSKKRLRQVALIVELLLLGAGALFLGWFFWAIVKSLAGLN